MKKMLFTLLVLHVLTGSLCAQVTERPRPAEWDNLVEGGRYMDRFLPMTDKTLATGTWGAPGVRRRYVDNGIEVDGLSFGRKHPPHG